MQPLRWQNSFQSYSETSPQKENRCRRFDQCHSLPLYRLQIQTYRQRQGKRYVGLLIFPPEESPGGRWGCAWFPNTVQVLAGNLHQEQRSQSIVRCWYFGWWQGCPCFWARWRADQCYTTVAGFEVLQWNREFVLSSISRMLMVASLKHQSPVPTSPWPVSWQRKHTYV